MSIFTPPKPHYAHEFKKLWKSLIKYYKDNFGE